MKSKLLLYLFVFTAVILVFQLVNSTKVVNFQAETLEMKNDRIEELKNELQAARAAYADDVHFSLDQNLEAQRYFPSSTPEEIIQRVKDKIYDSNAVKGENPLVPYSGNGRKFLINKVKILNHKWAIADFSDGTDWGELWLRYEVEENDIRLVVLDQLIYLTD